MRFLLDMVLFVRAKNEKPRPERGLVSDNVNFIDGGVNPAWSERHRINVIKLRDAGQHQNGFQTRLEAGQNIRTQVIADNNRFF